MIIVFFDELGGTIVKTRHAAFSGINHDIMGLHFAAVLRS